MLLYSTLQILTTDIYYSAIFLMIEEWKALDH